MAMFISLNNQQIKTMKKLNRFLAIVFVGLISTNIKAQLTTGNEQFFFNPVMVNPALAGMHNNQISLGYDTRWLGIDGAPRTGFINYDRMFNDNTGWNVAVISDQIGPINGYSIANSFSFKVQTSEETKLAFGLRHNLTQTFLNVNSSKLIDPTDLLLAADQTGVPVNNFDASIAWMNPNSFMIGFSYRNLIPQPRFRFTNTDIQPVLSVQGWYTRDFGEASIEAFGLLSTTSNTYINTNIGAMAAFQHKVGLGINFSPKNQLGVFTYIKLNEKLNVYYNYNFPLSEINKVSKQSHGVGISFRLGKVSPGGTTFFLQPSDDNVRTRMF